MLTVHTCTMIIVHTCTMIIVHARSMILVHSCTMIIVHACTMSIVHAWLACPMIIVHACTIMITVRACTMIVVHACTIIIVHACTMTSSRASVCHVRQRLWSAQFRSAGSRGRSTLGKKGVWGAAKPPNWPSPPNNFNSESNKNVVWTFGPLDTQKYLGVLKRPSFGF